MYAPQISDAIKTWTNWLHIQEWELTGCIAGLEEPKEGEERRKGSRSLLPESADVFARLSGRCDQTLRKGSVGRRPALKKPCCVWFHCVCMEAFLCMFSPEVKEWSEWDAITIFSDVKSSIWTCCCVCNTCFRCWKEIFPFYCVLKCLTASKAQESTSSVK